MPKKCLVVECTKVQKMKGYCSLHAKELLDPETWASCKLRHCKVSGCTAKIVFRKFCEEHGRQELGDERFDTLWNLHDNKCKETGCGSYPVKAGYCDVHARLRLGVVDNVNVLVTDSKNKNNCKIPGCQRQKNFKSMCLVHARQNLDPATFQSLYHAIKGCREPGCKKLHMIRFFCMKHARQNLEPRLFEELTRSFKWCKDSDCKKRVGARGRDGFCELHKTPLPSAAAMSSVSAIKNATVSRERIDIRTGSGDGDHDSTVDTASKDDRAPMDTSNSDEHPNENETLNDCENEDEDITRGEEDRERDGFVRGNYAQLQTENENLRSENKKLMLLLEKRDEESRVEVNKATH